MELISRQAALTEIDKNRDALLSSGMTGAEHILVHYGRRVIEELPTENPLVPILERFNSKYKEFLAKAEESHGLAINYYAGKTAGVKDAIRIVLNVWNEVDDEHTD